MGEENVQIRFQMINFMLYNLEIMINNLDFRFKTFMLLSFCLTNIAFTNPTISKTAKDVV